MRKLKPKHNGLIDAPGLFEVRPDSTSGDRIAFNRDRLLTALGQAFAEQDLVDLRRAVSVVKSCLDPGRAKEPALISSDSEWDAVSFARDVLVAELDQILEARTIERARYYLKRLARGVEGTKNGKLNDIN